MSQMAAPDMKAVLLSRKQQTARRWMLEGVTQSSSSDAGGLLDALTAGVEAKVRGELDRKQKPRESADVARKMDAYMEEQLRQTHSCQVCFEIMAPPSRTPTMLVPCGHTFCRECVDTHRSNSSAAASSACPLCRAPIASAAENRALRSLIDQFVGERVGLESNKASILRDAPASPRSRYVADYASAKLRRRILGDELSAAADEDARAAGVLKGVALTSAHLEAERADVDRRLRLLEAERDLVDRTLEAQRGKRDAAAAARDATAAKQRLLRETIASLDAQMAKARALAESLGGAVDE